MGALTALLFMAPRLRGYRLVAQSPASITRMALGKTKFAGGKTKHTRRASARELLIQSLHCALRPSSLYGLRRSLLFLRAGRNPSHEVPGAKKVFELLMMLRVVVENFEVLFCLFRASHALIFARVKNRKNRNPSCRWCRSGP